MSRFTHPDARYDFDKWVDSRMGRGVRAVRWGTDRLVVYAIRSHDKRRWNCATTVNVGQALACWQGWRSVVAYELWRNRQRLHEYMKNRSDS